MQNLALVTGGTKGVGAEIVSMLCKKKIPTIYTGRTLPPRPKPSEFEIPKELDLSDYDSIQIFLNDLKKEDLKPNILIHNAGVLSIKPKAKPFKMQQMFMTNAIGPLLLTQELLPSIHEGHVLFNAPPYRIDDKVKFLTPYMQSKLAQTTYMKSLAHILKKKPISVNSFWTGFPLWTSALELRNIGSKDVCMHPKILAKVVEQIVFHENPMHFKGNELIDESYLTEKNISLNEFKLGEKVEKLDTLFLSHLLTK